MTNIITLETNAIPLFSFGKSITKPGWTQAEVAPLMDLNDTWQRTLQSLAELGADDSGAPALPPPKMVAEDGDDSGLHDSSELHDNAELHNNAELHDNAEPQEDAEPELQDNLDEEVRESSSPGPGLDQENIAPAGAGNRIQLSGLRMAGLRQLDPNASYIRLNRVRL